MKHILIMTFRLLMIISMLLLTFLRNFQNIVKIIFGLLGNHMLGNIYLILLCWLISITNLRRRMDKKLIWKEFLWGMGLCLLNIFRKIGWSMLLIGLLTIQKWGAIGNWGVNMIPNQQVVGFSHTIYKKISMNLICITCMVTVTTMIH